jgi:hypothetical protein
MPRKKEKEKEKKAALQLGKTWPRRSQSRYQLACGIWYLFCVEYAW